MNYRTYTYAFFCAVLLLLTVGCTQDTPVAKHKPEAKIIVPEKSNPIPPSTQNKPEVKETLRKSNGIISTEKVTTNFVKCKTTNKILPENILELHAQNVTAFIGANDTTLDKDMGESHRIFEVKSGPNCEVVFSETLPVNMSPDFPYYLSKEASNEKLGLIGIRGFQNAVAYDVPTKKLYADLKPKFLTEREAADATSGMISNLFFDQNYLYGYAVDFGVFGFDMKKNGSPQLPIAEFGETQLFGFEREKNHVDIMIPIVTFNEDGSLDLKMKNIFERTIRINPALKFKFHNGKYILFKEKMGTAPTNHLVVDMDKKERLDLPKEIAESSIQKVMEYLK